MVDWAANRFGQAIDLDDFKNKQREEIADVLLGLSRHSQAEAEQKVAETQRRLADLFGETLAETAAHERGIAPEAIASLTEWVNRETGASLDARELSRLSREEAEPRC